MCTMQRHSKPFWQSLLVPTRWGFYRTLTLPAQEWCIPWPTRCLFFTQWWTEMTLTWNTPNLCTAPPPPVNCWMRSANHANAAARRTNNPSHVAKKIRKRRRMTMMHQQKHLPPLQEISMQEAPLRWPGQMHVEQEKQRMPFQIHMRWAWGDIQTTPHVYGRTGWVCKKWRFWEQMMVHRDKGFWEEGW